jgi:Glycerophosphoryl diester phosphodiesterase family
LSQKKQAPFPLKRYLIFLIVCSPALLYSQECCLKNAHSHNDYKHRQPLSDALSFKFKSIEADVFLMNGQVLVSHIYPIFKRKKLEELYLKPLLDSCKKHNGKVYADCKESLILLIDIKSDAEKTYTELKKIFGKYRSILSTYENGIMMERGVTIILSGNKPFEQLQRDSTRYAFIDQNLISIQQEKNNSIYLMASTKYSNIIQWKGAGELPIVEKEKLKILVNNAHGQGKTVRLWASPENKKVWQELLDCGVDLINTDDLQTLSDFLIKKK